MLALEITLLVLFSLAGYLYLRSYFRDLPSRPPIVREPGFGKVDIFLAGFLILVLLSSAVDSFTSTKKPIINANLIVVSCMIYAGLLMGILSALVIQNRNPITLFGLKWSNWKRALPPALLALVAALPLIQGVQVIVQSLLGPHAGVQDVLAFLTKSSDWRDKATVVFMAAVCAPLAEEFIFRGYIYGVLRQYGGFWFGLIISALVFALIHGHIPSLAGLFVFAILLTLIYEKTGSLWASILVHSAFNSITLAATLLWPSSVP